MSETTENNVMSPRSDEGGLCPLTFSVRRNSLSFTAPAYLSVGPDLSESGPGSSRMQQLGGELEKMRDRTRRGEDSGSEVSDDMCEEKSFESGSNESIPRLEDPYGAGVDG